MHMHACDACAYVCNAYIHTCYARQLCLRRARQVGVSLYFRCPHSPPVEPAAGQTTRVPLSTWIPPTNGDSLLFWGSNPRVRVRLMCPYIYIHVLPQILTYILTWGGGLAGFESGEVSGLTRGVLTGLGHMHMRQPCVSHGGLQVRDTRSIWRSIWYSEWS